MKSCPIVVLCVVNFPRFIVHHSCGKARTGTIETAHGNIATPAFLFCATHASLKGLSLDQIKSVNTPVLLSNTYHLMVQPGSELIQSLGGLHQFMAWDGPIFTDSGGYQIFSLFHGSVSEEIKGNRRGGGRVALPPVKVSEEGALFVSHRDGKRMMLTPERSVQVQRHLGSDLMCVLDECTPLRMTKDQTAASMYLSHRWAQRCLTEFYQQEPSGQGLYGIVQGGVYPDLRQISVEETASKPFFGHAIGGSLGNSVQQMRDVVDMAMASGQLSARPIHLLGIGGVDDIFYGVTQGIDTFDCVSPTRLGRHGGALVQPHYWNDASQDPAPKHHINLWNACFQKDQRPIDSACPCPTCRSYSRAYLHHLLKARELLALSALTLHNVSFMNRCMHAIRQGILSHSLTATWKQWSMPYVLGQTEMTSPQP